MAVEHESGVVLSVVSQPPSKRPRPAMDDYSFRLQVDHIASLRQLASIIGSVLKHVEFTLTPHPTLEQTVILSVDSIDPGNVCMVQSRLTCTGTLEASSVSFCVDTKTLNTCLRNVKTNHAIELCQYRGTSDVHMNCILVQMDGSCAPTDLSFQLSTLDVTSETIDLDSLDYDYVMHINMPQMKSVLKLAKDLACTSIRMRVLTEGQTQSTQTILLEVSGKGDAAFTRLFVSSVVNTEGGNDSHAMKDVEAGQIDPKSMHVVSAQNYKLEYMIDFLKNMDQQMLTMKMGKELPILLHYDLGVEGSFVRFVMAPNVDDT